jgi:hypothetical protein
VAGLYGTGVAGLVAGSLQAEARQLLDKIGRLLPSMAAAVARYLDNLRGSTHDVA